MYNWLNVNSRIISRVYVRIGWDCNAHCRYCLQTPSVSHIETKEPTEETYKFLEALIDSRPESQEPLRIYFWGGEPLVYESIIRKVVERLGGRPWYFISTNGLLLSDSFVDFANVNDIHVFLSHDGVNTKKTRGYDVLENPKFVTRFLKLRHKGINGVFSPYNYDMPAFWAYYRKKFPSINDLSVEPLRVTWDMPNDLYEFPPDLEEKLAAEGNIILNEWILTNSHTSRRGSFLSFGIDAILRTEQDTWTTPNNCSAGYASLNIDCEGNIFSCHNSSEKIAHISWDRANIIEAADNFVTEHRPKECDDCEVGAICRGGCQLEPKELKKKSCRLMKAYYKTCAAVVQAYRDSFEQIEVPNDDRN